MRKNFNLKSRQSFGLTVVEDHKQFAVGVGNTSSVLEVKKEKCKSCILQSARECKNITIRFFSCHPLQPHFLSGFVRHSDCLCAAFLSVSDIRFERSWFWNRLPSHLSFKSILFHWCAVCCSESSSRPQRSALEEVSFTRMLLRRIRQ